MVRNKNYVIQNKQNELSDIIKGRIAQINTPQYPKGPALHFYLRVMDLRRQYPLVPSFLACDACVEILYATLVSWDMNSRAAEMKDYADFKSNLQGNSSGFQAVEMSSVGFTWTNRGTVVRSLSVLFDLLALMKTDERVVSNSKCLHFVFPGLSLPVDNNTFAKLYRKNAAGTKARFLEVLALSYDILAGIQNPQQYLDSEWNACETKLVDNAIILM